jgi:hypothetical protein
MDSLVNLQFLVDDARCFETVRRLRWPEGVRCPVCASDKVARHGHDDLEPDLNRRRIGLRAPDFLDYPGEVFLNASWAAGSVLGWIGWGLR